MKSILQAATCRCGVLLYIGFLLASGCMSYRTGGLPNVEIRKQDADSHKKPTVYFATTCQTRMCAETVFQDNIAAAQSFRGILAGVLDDSGPFESYTFTANHGTNADLRILLTLKSEENASVFGLVLSIATLTLVPATAAETHRLTAQVFDKSGKARGNYEVEDSMRTWIQLVFLPLGSWKSPVKTQKELMKNLVRTTLSQMKADGLLTIPQ